MRSPAPQESPTPPPPPTRARWWRRRSERKAAEALFLEHRPRIERAAQRAARRAGFTEQEVEDFVSIATVALIEDDYGRIRKHRGQSSLPTFLVTVVNNLFKDHLNQRFGKFRPSQAAKRLGPTALALERLLILDSCDLESAIEILVRNHRVEESREELYRMAETLPKRRPRPKLSDDEMLDERADPDAGLCPESSLEENERLERAAEVQQALGRALEGLDPQDRLILQMCFRDDCAISTVAKSLGLVQRSLYSRREKCYRDLRSSLEEEGITWDVVEDLLGWSGAEIRVRIDSTEDENRQPTALSPEEDDAAGGNRIRGPSNSKDSQ